MNEENLNRALMAMYGMSEEEYNEMIAKGKEKYGWMENPANYPCLVRADGGLFLCNSIDEATGIMLQCAFVGVDLEIADELDLSMLVVKERLV